MRKKERRQDRGHITTEAESGHHVSCSDFTLTDHFSRFALKFHLHVHNSRFKFTLGFIVRDSLSARSSRDAGTTCAPPSIPHASEAWLHGQATARMDERERLIVHYARFGHNVKYQCI